MSFPRLPLSLDAGCPVEWDDPLNGSLVSRWQVAPLGHPSYFGGPLWHDLARRNPGTLAGGVSWSGALGRPGGRGSLSFGGSGSGHSVTVADHSSLDFGTGEFTVAAWVYAGSLAGVGSGNIIAVKAEGSGAFAGWALRVINGGGSPQADLWPYNSGGDFVRGATVLAAGSWYHVAGVRRSGNINVYVNGVADATPVANTVNVDNAIDLVVGGAVSGWAGVEWDGRIDDLRIWSRGLADAEVYHAYEDSLRGNLRTLRRLNRRAWFVQSSATAYSLTASAGAFTLSGQAAAPKHDWRVTAAAGSFALSGQAAALKRGLVVAGGTGAFTLSGQAASLAWAHKVTASAGAFILTGQDAALLKGRTVVAGVGSFALSGQDAGLRAAHKVVASAGAFTLTGQDAALLKGRTLTASAGSFTLSGQAAALKWSHVLTASAGSYSLSGQAASLKAGRVVVAAAGPFTLSGQAAALKWARKVTASAGSFTLTGQSATLTYSGGLVPPVVSATIDFPHVRAATVDFPHTRTATLDMAHVRELTLDFGEAASHLSLGTMHVLSNEQLDLTILKDGEEWAGIDSVTLVFQRPAGTQFTRDADPVSGSLWRYTVTADDVDARGRWGVGVRVVDGSVSDRYPRRITLLATDPCGLLVAGDAALLDGLGNPLTDGLDLILQGAA